MFDTGFDAGVIADLDAAAACVQIEATQAALRGQEWRELALAGTTPSTALAPVRGVLWGGWVRPTGRASRRSGSSRARSWGW